jgi:hypothetical protein
MSRALESMQSFSLDVGKYKGLFSVRRPKQDGFLCTLEAVAYALDVTESKQVSPMLLRPMLRVCIQEEEFALQRGGLRHRCNHGYHLLTYFSTLIHLHRPEAPGYRACLMQDVRAAAAAVEAHVADVRAAAAAVESHVAAAALCLDAEDGDERRDTSAASIPFPTRIHDTTTP